jgi:hypothetical protein
MVHLRDIRTVVRYTSNMAPAWLAVKRRSTPKTHFYWHVTFAKPGGPDLGGVVPELDPFLERDGELLERAENAAVQAASLRSASQCSSGSRGTLPRACCAVVVAGSCWWRVRRVGLGGHGGAAAAAAAGVLLRRRRILGGSPLAARRAFSSRRAFQAALMHWLWTASSTVVNSISGVSPVRWHQPQAVQPAAGFLTAAKRRPAAVRRA